MQTSSDALRRNKIESGLSNILEEFVGGDDGRTACVQSLSGISVECSKNGNVLRPAASVMKLPMIMAIYKKAALGLVELDIKYPISTFSTTRYVSVLAAFSPDTAFSVREICRLAVITSDNPLAVFLKTLVSFEEVNSLLFEVCSDDRISMSAGFSETELGPKNRLNALTGDACLKLLSEINENTLYSDILLAMKNNLRGTRIPVRLPESAIVAHKTGSLAGVVNDIAIIEGEQVKFEVAFLTDNQPDTVKTVNDISASALAIYECLKSNKE